jgi:hypothetical protein
MRSRRSSRRRCTASERRTGPEAGFVTAELASAIPVLVVLLGVAIWAVVLAGDTVRAQDAARELARAAARGDTATGQQMAHEIAPSAGFTTVTSDATVVATVQMVVHPLAGWLPAVTVHGRAVAAVEPGADGRPP